VERRILRFMAMSKLPAPRQRHQYLEQRPEYDREEPDPPEDGGDVVELLHLNVDAPRTPGQGLAGNRDAVGQFEREQKYDTDQVQKQAEDLQRLARVPFFAYARRARAAWRVSLTMDWALTTLLRASPWQETQWRLMRGRPARVESSTGLDR